MKKLIYALAMFAIITTMAQARPFTDSAGRTVEVPDRIERVLTAGPPASVLIYTLAPEKLAGWVREPKKAELPFLLPEVRGLPTYGRLTGKGGTANVEAVLAAKPDLIIDVGTINDTYISLADKVQQQTGIPYVLIDGSFAKSAETYKLLGDLIGARDRAAKLSAYTQVTLDQLHETLSAVPEGKRPRVYYGRGPEGLETGLAGSINLEILEAAGATNVAASAGKGGLTNVSLEQLLQWNPDKIIAEDPKFAEAVKTDARWSGVKAVRDGRIFVPPSLPFGWFDTPPGVNRLIGIRWLEELFYPDVYKTNLRDDVREFYKLFYQVDLSDQQTDDLLTGAVAALQ
ncbi:iron ABC transporter substrate-binding protein [Candidatus Phyllobacterium onerii]|uniref:iron ABC transporter substrate-binding protein n=1 Tax=Candidatus Phyllobacterium onerii TaxID=3020828 RepID=UPI003A8894E2